jgi:hypothetical protein
MPFDLPAILPARAMRFSEISFPVYKGVMNPLNFRHTISGSYTRRAVKRIQFRLPVKYVMRCH